MRLTTKLEPGLEMIIGADVVVIGKITEYNSETGEVIFEIEGLKEVIEQKQDIILIGSGIKKTKAIRALASMFGTIGSFAQAECFDGPMVAGDWSLKKEPMTIPIINFRINEEFDLDRTQFIDNQFRRPSYPKPLWFQGSHNSKFKSKNIKSNPWKARMRKPKPKNKNR
jgi:hypothetical protein